MSRYQNPSSRAAPPRLNADLQAEVERKRKLADAVTVKRVVTIRPPRR